LWANGAREKSFEEWEVGGGGCKKDFGEFAAVETGRWARSGFERNALGNGRQQRKQRRRNGKTAGLIGVAGIVNKRRGGKGLKCIERIKGQVEGENGTQKSTKKGREGGITCETWTSPSVHQQGIQGQLRRAYGALYAA